MVRAFISTLALAMYVPFAHSQSRCECEYDKWQGDCTAKIDVSGDWARITSNTQQCSRVDWVIEGQPQVTIVTDGTESQQLLHSKDNPKLAIQSCKICKDAMYKSGKAPITELLTEMRDAQRQTGFAGSWGGGSSNTYGVKFATTANLVVNGNSITGNWFDSNGGGKEPAPVTGSISGDKQAKIKVHGTGTASLTLTLIDDNTLKYKWLFGGGTLTRQ